MRRSFIHLDLFSGIGGFALATEMVWNNVEHIFCDNDPFSQAILKKHWPNSLIYGDIREFTKERIVADTQSKQAHSSKQEGLHTESGISDRRGWSSIDLLTGGFPCQPFSSAGRRAGTADNRHLWPEMLRVIREFHPTYVLGENVGGFLTWEGGLVFEQVCTDLEAEGYEVCPFVIPAVALNAPHRRDRVWIAAHAKNADDRGDSREVSSADEQQEEERQKERSAESRRANHPGRETVANTKGEQTHATKQSGLHSESSSTTGDASDTQSARGKRRSPATSKRTSRTKGWNEAWSENKGRNWSDWYEAATKLCTLDDGLPNGLARPKGWRDAALKGAGNAIVPQIAAEILRVMREMA